MLLCPERFGPHPTGFRFREEARAFHARACLRRHGRQLVPYAREMRKFATEIGRNAEQRSMYLKHELAVITHPSAAL
jgi:hypothetical protein